MSTRIRTSQAGMMFLALMVQSLKSIKRQRNVLEAPILKSVVGTWC